MKKYRVTEKHPYLKEGHIIEKAKKANCFVLRQIEYDDIIFDNDDIFVWVNLEFIQEIQEPEFTKDDIWDYYRFLFRTTMIVTKESFEKTLNAWQDENKNN